MLNVQRYLMKHTFEDLESELGIVISYYDDRVVLNYSQIESPKNHPICNECRGLILDRQDLSRLCRSFDRFYNYGEVQLTRDQFDINRSEAAVKIDGSLINIYNDGIEWCCATRKMAFAEGQTTKGNTFKSVVERALGFPVEEFQYKLTEEMKDYTLICEVVSPETRVVIPYPEYKLYILAIRNKYTGEYLDKEDIDNIVYTYWLEEGANLDRPDVYNFKTFEDCIKVSKELEPMDHNGEGFVLVDTKTQERIKIKNPSYVQLHHLRDNGAISNKRIALLVFEQDHEEYLGYFEEDREFFQPYIDAYDKMIYDITHIWYNTKNIENQKEFALQVKDLPISSILFQLRKGLTLDEIFDNLNEKTKMRLLEQYKEFIESVNNLELKVTELLMKQGQGQGKE